MKKKYTGAGKLINCLFAVIGIAILSLIALKIIRYREKKGGPSEIADITKTATGPITSDKLELKDEDSQREEDEGSLEKEDTIEVFDLEDEDSSEEKDNKQETSDKPGYISSMTGIFVYIKETVIDLTYKVIGYFRSLTNKN